MYILIVTFVPLSNINSAVEKDMLSMDRTLRTYRKIDERIPTSIYLHLVVTEGEISKYKVVWWFTYYSCFSTLLAVKIKNVAAATKF